MRFNWCCLQGYREDDGLTLESDTDEQILMHIPFQQAVCLTGIVIKCAHDIEKAPKKVKLFVNNPTIGFNGKALSFIKYSSLSSNHVVLSMYSLKPSIPISFSILVLRTEAGERSGVEEFDLSISQLKGEVVNLRPVKFSRVNSLSIFVETNQGDEDSSIIQKIVLMGKTRERMDVASIKDVSKEND